MKMKNFLKLCVLLALTCELQASDDGLWFTLNLTINFFCGKVLCVPGALQDSEATSKVSSNPSHFKTFDGKTSDFQGSGPGTYTLSKTSDNDINLPGLSIKIINQNQSSANNMNPTLVITDPSQNIVIKLNDNMLIKVNNLKTFFNMSISGFNIIIQTDFAVSVQYDLRTALKNGMFGNYNGNSADDFETPSGTQAAGPAEFGKSWTVDD